MAGRIIAVCGSPNTGKTTVAIKIAERLYTSGGGAVLYVSPDLVVPAMAYLFPTAKAANLHSLGLTLDKTEIMPEDVLKEVVNVASNFGFLGYKSGENKYSYPAVTNDKVVMLFNSLTDVADYVIVDCTCAQDDKISAYAKKYGESVVRMISPDLKCMTYYASNFEEFEDTEDRAVTAMNIMDQNVFYPVDEVENFFGGAVIELPYCLGVKSQALIGTGNTYKLDPAYTKQIDKLVRIVTGEDPIPISAKEAKKKKKEEKRAAEERRRANQDIQI